MASQMQTARHVARIDRVGHALAAGASLCGLVATAFVAAGGQGDPLRLILAFLVATLFSALGIVAVAAPVWLVLHILGRRGARDAGIAGFAVALLIAVSAQTYGFGVFATDALDTGTLAYRWASAVAAALLFAVAGGGIALLMWSITYRRAV